MRMNSIVVSFRKDQGAQGEGPYLFRTFPSPQTASLDPLHRNPGDASKDPIVDVARATSAAPTYFAPHQIGDNLFMDGGIVANNPTWLAFREVQQVRRFKANSVALVLSIGTGKSGPLSAFGEGLFGRYWALLKYAKKKASESEEPHTKMEEYVREHRHQARNSQPAQHTDHRPLVYERLNVEIGLENMKLDDWKCKNRLGRAYESNRTLDKIKNVTRTYLDDAAVQTKLNELAEILVNSRRERLTRPNWDRWCSGSTWCCEEHDCDQGSFTTSSELERHLITYHRFRAGDNALVEAIKKGRRRP